MSSQEYSVDRKKLAKRPPIHPRVIFAEEVMPELRKDRTIAQIAELLNVSRATLHRVMAGDIAISVDMAVRLGKLCGNGPDLWLNLQKRYDLHQAQQELGAKIKDIPTLEVA